MPGREYEYIVYRLDLASGESPVFSNENIQSLSPDGQYVAIARLAFGERWQIDISRLDGADRWALANDSLWVLNPLWSASGEWLLATVSATDSGSTTGALINLRTCRVISLPHLEGNLLDWKPGSPFSRGVGRRWAFCAHRYFISGGVCDMIPSCQSNPFLQPQLIAQLHALGVQPGGVLLVRCAFSKVKPVEGGPAGLIAALQAATGPAGTLVMPSMSWDDEHPFDPRSTPASKKWAWSPIPSGGSRASCAATARIPAAAGPQAARITAPHPVEIPTASTARWGASTSWTGRCCCSASTHHPTPPSTAELLAGVRYRRPKSVLVRGRADRPRRLRRERPLLPELCPRGWLAGREGSPAPRRGGSCRGAPDPARVTLSKRW